jgi:hypothetical protein
MVDRRSLLLTSFLSPSTIGDLGEVEIISTASSVNVLDFGADPLGSEDSTSAIDRAIHTQRSVFLPAGKYLISRSSDLTNCRGIFGLGDATLIAHSDFSGDALCVAGVSSKFGDWWDKGRISGLLLDGNNYGVGGIRLINARHTRIIDVDIINVGTFAVRLEAGYGNQFSNFTAQASNKARSDAVGLWIQTSDNQLVAGEIISFPTGVLLDRNAGNNELFGIHPWGSYDPDRLFMYIGFKVLGEGNTFTSCCADSPAVVNRNMLPSVENGGIGWVIDVNGQNTALLGCRVIASGSGTNVPPDRSLKAVLCNQSLLYCIALRTRSYINGVNFAHPNIWTDNKLLEQTFTIIGNRT